MIYKEYKDEKIAKYLQWAKAWNWVPMIFSMLSLLGLIISATTEKDTALFDMFWLFALTLTTPLVMNDTLKWNPKLKDKVMTIIGFILACIFGCLHLGFSFGSALFWIGNFVFIFLIDAHKP